MSQTLLTPSQVADKILTGGRLLVAGEESLLRALPRGLWIGGTTPYFMTEQGGLCATDRLFVTELPAAVSSVSVVSHDAQSLPALADGYAAHGFSVLLVPGMSTILASFARDVSNFPGIFNQPLAGWITGVALDRIGSDSPKVFDGTTGQSFADRAVVLHATLPERYQARIDIINLFSQGQGAVITFDQAGFSAGDCRIDGVPANLAAYLTGQQADTRLPLVADYYGAMVNVSIQAVDAGAGTVAFYAPVFPGIEYRLAAPVDDYVGTFNRQAAGAGQNISFFCNCILNYLYAGLEGQRTGDLSGPITFGEIAYILLNQTAVTLYVEDTAGGESA